MKKSILLVVGGILCATGNSISSSALRAEINPDIRPDAGSIMRDQLPKFPPVMPLLPAEAVNEPTPLPVEEVPDNSIRVMVKNFTFTGYEELVTEKELLNIVSSSTGKELSYNELEKVTEQVTNLLKQKGWFLSKAYLPPQDVTAGTVEIAITPGNSEGKAQIKFDKTVRIKRCLIECITKDIVRKGQPINEKSLAHAVLLMNDLPGLSARSSIATGKEPGTSLVEIAVTEAPLIRGFLLGDNYGNRYTGIWRASAMVGANDPFHIGDQMSLMVTNAEGLSQGRASYTFPILLEGLKANVAGTLMSYRLVQELQPLDYHGESVGVDAGLSNPILRSRNSNAVTTFTYSYKALIDSKSSTKLRDRTLNSLTIGANGDRQDTLWGGGNTSWNIGLTAGTFHDAIDNVDLTKTDGNYTRFNYGVTRMQRLAERTTLTINWKAQKTIKNLDSSEKFTLGGPYGLRAYPVGEATGDEGDIINTDIRYNIPAPPAWGNFQISSFYDAGFIKRNRVSTTIPLGSATNLNHYWLQGAGVGLSYAFPGKVAIQGCWAHTIGDNPGRSVYGNNADGRNDNNRFWIQALMYF